MPKQPSQLSLDIWDYRFRIRRFRMSIKRIRLGARGKYALSRLLSAEELPFEVLGLRFERAYNSRKEYVALQQPSADYKYQVIAERSFAIFGCNHSLKIRRRPFYSPEKSGR